MADAQYFADRVRVYAKAVRGPVRRAKSAVAAVLLAIYYTLPWLRWDRDGARAHQAVLLDISGERFYFFKLELWPQEIYLLVGFLVLAALALFLVSSLVGRVWCGYGCPQTVWTDLFMLVERAVEGDRTQRMRRDRHAVTAGSLARKAVKHGLWLLIALATGATLVLYFGDAPTVLAQVATGRASMPVYFFLALVTAATYLLAGWAREQVCIYMCPWPRFQAAMFDEQTLTVTYQAWRGEPRAKGRKAVKYEGAGDCVDCGQCIAVCPTGIDIREGVQLGCLNCGLCIDACNGVMDKLARPRGLITWDNLAGQTAKLQGLAAPLRLLRARSLFYLALLLIGGTTMALALSSRPTITLEAARDRAPLFVMLRDGALRNGYTIRIDNRTPSDPVMELRLAGLPGAVMALAESGVPAGDALTLAVSPDTVATYRVLVTVPPGRVAGLHPLDFRLRDPATGEQALFHGAFAGPDAP